MVQRSVDINGASRLRLEFMHARYCIRFVDGDAYRGSKKRRQGHTYYIYIYRERDMYIHISLYIYIYIYIRRQGHGRHGPEASGAAPGPPPRGRLD